MTQEQTEQKPVQIPADNILTFQLTIAKVEQMAAVLVKQPFEAVSSFLPELLMQANSQVAGMMIKAKNEQEKAQ